MTQRYEESQRCVETAIVTKLLGDNKRPSEFIIGIIIRYRDLISNKTFSYLVYFRLHGNAHQIKVSGYDLRLL